MAREPKFRAWHKEKKRWEYFTLLELGLGEASFMFEDLENWCQYTGLKDKNGKEVWEGDLVQLIDVESEPLEVMIGGYWPTRGDASFGVHVTNQKQDYVREVSPFSTDNNLVVIGNIYSNPELIK